MKYTLLILAGILASSGCAYVTTKTVRERQVPTAILVGLVGTNKLTKDQERMFIVKEVSKTRAMAFFESEQAIKAAQAKQTEATQTAGFSDLNQVATSSNLVLIIQAVIEGAIKGAAMASGKP